MPRRFLVKQASKKKYKCFRCRIRNRNKLCRLCSDTHVIRKCMYCKKEYVTIYYTIYSYCDECYSD